MRAHVCTGFFASRITESLCLSHSINFHRDEQADRAASLATELERQRAAHSAELGRLAAAHASEVGRLSAAHEAEAERLSAVAGGKDAMIQMLQTQVASAQGSLAKTALDAAVAGVTAAAVHHSHSDGGPGRATLSRRAAMGGTLGGADGGGGPSHEEDLILLADEVAALSAQVGALSSQLESAHSELDGARNRVAQLEGQQHQQQPPRSPGRAAQLGGAAAAHAMGLGGPYGDVGAFGGEHSEGGGLTGAARLAVLRGGKVQDPAFDQPAPTLPSAAAAHGAAAGELSRLRLQLDAARDELDGAKSALGASRRELESLSAKLSDREAAAARLQAALDDTQAAVSAAQGEARSTAANLRTSEVEGERARRRAAAAEERVSELGRAAEGLRAELEAARAQASDASRVLAARSAELDRAHRECDALREALSRASAEVEDARSALQAARAEAARAAQAMAQQLQRSDSAVDSFIGADRDLQSGSRDAFRRPAGVEAPQATYALPIPPLQRQGRGRTSLSTQHNASQVPLSHPGASGDYGAPPGRGSQQDRWQQEQRYPDDGPRPYQEAQPQLRHAAHAASRSPTRHSGATDYTARDARGDTSSRLFGGGGASEPLALPPRQPARARSSPPRHPPVPVPQPPAQLPIQRAIAFADHGSEVGHLQSRPDSEQDARSARGYYPLDPEGPYHRASSGSQYQPADAAAPHWKHQPADEPWQPRQPQHPALQPRAPDHLQQHGAMSAADVFTSDFEAHTAAQAVVDAERARRLAILADIAAGGTGGGPHGTAQPQPPARPPQLHAAYAPQPHAPAAPPSSPALPNPYGLQPLRRGRAAVDAPGSPSRSAASSGMQAALPISGDVAAAVRADEASRRAAADSEHAREAAVAQAREREKMAPFGTAAAAQDVEAAIADAEARLLSANMEKEQVDSELAALGHAAPRTLRDRSRKQELLEQQAALQRRLSELRMWLKAHAL